MPPARLRPEIFEPRGGFSVSDGFRFGSRPRLVTFHPHGKPGVAPAQGRPLGKRIDAARYRRRPLDGVRHLVCRVHDIGWRAARAWLGKFARRFIAGTPDALRRSDRMSPDEVRSRLTDAFPDAQVEVVDLTGTHDHYQATVVSAAFEGKTPIQQHQLVYGALGAAMDGPIHALALKTYTPQTWNQRQRGPT